MRLLIAFALAAITTTSLLAQIEVTRQTLLAAEEPVLPGTSGSMGLSADNAKLIFRRNVEEGASVAQPYSYILIDLDDQGNPTGAGEFAGTSSEYSRYVSGNPLKVRSDALPKPTKVKAVKSPKQNYIIYGKNTFQKLAYPLGQGKAKDLKLSESPFGGADVGLANGLGGAVKQLTDPVSGAIVLAGDVKYKKDKTKKSSPHFEHRIVTFNAEGEIVNNLDYKTEAPYRIKHVMPIFADHLNAQKGRYDYVAVLFAGSKVKKGPENDRRNHRVVIVNTQTGEITADEEVNLGVGYADFNAVFTPAPGITSHFYVGSYKNNAGMGFLTIGKDGIVESKVYDHTTAEYKTYLKGQENPQHSAINYKRFHFVSSPEGTAYLGAITKKEAKPTPKGEEATAPLKKEMIEKTLSRLIIAFSPDGRISKLGEASGKGKFLSGDNGQLVLLDRKDGVTINTISATGEENSFSFPEELTLASTGPVVHNAAKRKLYVFGYAGYNRGIDMVTFSY